MAAMCDRFVQHRSDSSKYDGQPHISVSRDGSRFTFNSNMMGSTTDVYLVVLSGGAGTELPSIFTVNGQGTGQGAIEIANSSFLAATPGSVAGAQTRPAKVGEFITIYCASLGSVTNPPSPGAPASVNPLSTTISIPQVTIGGVAANVSFSGLTPNSIGLYQVAVR